MNNRKEFLKKRTIRGAICLLLCMLLIPLFAVKAEAATTCKSRISYPGTTNASVNFRKKAGTKYQTYGILSKGQSVTILGWCENKGTKWYKCKAKIKGKTKTGYIAYQYVTRKSKPAGYVNDKVTSTVHVRKSAKSSSKSLMKVPAGTDVQVTGIKKKSGKYWYKVKVTYNGKTKTGYVLDTYITVGKNPAGTSTDSNSKEVLGYVNDKVTSSLNIRNKATTKSAILVAVPKKTEVTILGTSGSWYQVKLTYNKKTYKGYASKEYISLKKVENSSTTDTTTTETTSTSLGYVNEKVTSSLNVRSKASTSGTVLVAIPRNTEVTILGTSGSWYQIQVVYNKKTYKGYVAKEYITLKKAEGNSSDSNQNDSAVTDQSFEVLLENFPESYKASLRALHTQYPNWRFVAVNTNLDWSTVIGNESVVGRNVIQSNYPKGTATLAPFSYLSTESGAYDWSKDSYVVKDGTNWYSASSEVIAYYMDPRNFLNSTDIFQFEALAYDSAHSGTVVQSILSNTFMKGNYSVYDSTTKKTVKGSYKDAFMDAGKGAAANPYFLATRVKQEVGVNGSNATSGTYRGYEGIYNFYNIGAFDGTDAVAKGLQWAQGGASGATTYGRPWTTPYKSIVGGAQYIAKNYINQGQNTLYFQKFNVKPKDASDLYLHQYMTNVQAPYAEGRTTRAAYNTMGILSDSMVFYIPVYNNMPSSACQLPAATGNPNPYLSSIKLYNGSTELAGLTPTFKYNQYEYTLVVPKAVSTVTVKASTVSKYASVSGTGSVSLKAAGQTTTIKVVGTAQNGKKQTYTIKVTRNTK